MNKTRFYEIIVAHAKGEDLSVFVPKNPAEAALIANLQGGAGSSGGSGMPDIELNNPDLPGLYHGLVLQSKTKFVFDFVKYIAYLDSIGDTTLDNPVPDGSGGGCGTLLFVILSCDYTTDHGMWNNDACTLGIGGSSLSISMNGQTLFYQDNISNSLTIRDLFNMLGKIEMNVSEMGLADLTILTNVPVPLALNVTVPENLRDVYGVNLNENPIDYMWFE